LTARLACIWSPDDEPARHTTLTVAQDSHTRRPLSDAEYLEEPLYDVNGVRSQQRRVGVWLKLERLLGRAARPAVARRGVACPDLEKSRTQRSKCVGERAVEIAVPVTAAMRTSPVGPVRVLTYGQHFSPGIACASASHRSVGE
jgi:hypothetical protein